MSKLRDIQAGANLLLLKENPYPGRGIVMGFDQLGHVVQIYWIMGRSQNSRNRLFVRDSETGSVYTEPVDPSKVTDPALIIYDAMLEATNRDSSRKIFAVSNGHQTTGVVNSVKSSYSFVSFERALSGWRFEPDAPNFTPRITGYYELGASSFQLSVIRECEWTGGTREANTYEYEYSPDAHGFGMCVTTYRGDGDPLPSFNSKPYVLPLAGSAETLAETYWDTLNEENRVAIAVKVIDPVSGKSRTAVINRFYRQ